MVVRGVEQGIYSSFAELEVEEALAQSREGRREKVPGQVDCGQGWRVRLGQCEARKSRRNQTQPMWAALCTILSFRKV